MIRLRVITEFRDFESREGDWRRLHEECGGHNPFLSYDWLVTWWRHFGGGKQLCIVAAEQDGATVGIAPLMSTRVAGSTKVQFIGKPLSDYSDFLVQGERDTCAQSLVEFIKSNLRCDAVELRGIREDSPNFQVLRDAWSPSIGLTQCRPVVTAPVLRIRSDWSEYANGLKQKLRADNRRRIRRLEEIGELKFRECASLDEALQLLEWLARQKSQRYVSTGAKDILRNGHVLGFYKEAISRLWEPGQVHVSSLDLNDHPIAVHFGFVCGQQYLYYMPSFDTAFSPYSPGRLLLFNLIHASFLRGLHEFDFMNGADPYKYEWTSEECRVYEVALFRRSLRGFALYGAHEAHWRARASPLIRGWARGLRKGAGRLRSTYAHSN